MSLIYTVIKLDNFYDSVKLAAFKFLDIDKDFQEEVINFIKKEEASLSKIKDGILKKEFLTTFFREAAPKARKENWYFKPNYDYNEGWNVILDEFRKGKVKDVKDFIRKKRKQFPKSKKENLENQINTKTENPDKDFKKQIQRGSLKEAEETLFHTEAYCAKEKNLKYWRELEKFDSKSKALEDFIKYIEEVEC